MTQEEELALIHKKPAPGPVAEAVPDQRDAATAATKTPEQIDAELGLEPPEMDIPPLPKDASTWDIMGAAYTASTIKGDDWGYYMGRRKALAHEMYDNLTPESRANVMRQVENPTVNSGVTGFLEFSDMVIGQVNREMAIQPDGGARWAAYPTSAEDFTARINKDRHADLNEAQAILDQPGGGISEFLGSAARDLTGPVNILTAPLGGWGGGWKFLAGEFAAGALSSALELPGEISTARDMGLPQPDATTNILVGGATQAGFGAVLAAVPKIYRKFFSQKAAHQESIAAATPEGGDKLGTEVEIDRAEAKLREEEGAKASLADDGTLPAIVTDNRIPEVSADAPEGWGKIRNGIFAGESGGDYNALFGFQNRKGGKFSRVKLTEMTVDQAIAFSDPKGAYGQWVKGKIGRVATPMGAYQIVGTTLRAAKRALGLAGDEVMTPELQERLGHWIYRSQGTGAWEGYKGPRDTFTPSGADRDAPAYGSNTSRGYTGEGQVAVGDSTKIDVEYVVVDIASLTRASGDLQPRDRSRSNSDAWIADTAARLDPAQLMPAPTADRGAPIVGPDSVIESGNGRFAAVERAYEYHPDRATAYRAQIEAAGFSVPEGVDRPILVARRKTDLTPDQRRQLVIDAQDSGVAVMTPTEVARASSRAMTAPVLGRMDLSQPLTADANGDFVRAALAGLPRSARNAMFDAGGMLNASGQRQLREAMFARAWNDPDIIEMFTEADQGELKGLMDALATAAPNWAALKADIEAGLVQPEMDISGHVLDAMRLIASARKLASREGMTTSKALAELLDDVDLIEGAVAPLTTALVRKFWKNGRAASADDVAGFLARYADDARKAGSTADMFGATTPRDVLRAIDKDAFANLPEDLGPVRGFARPAQQTMPHEGYDTGASSAEAELEDAAVRDALEPAPAPSEPFGPVFDGLENDPEGAILKLMQEKAGEVPNAFVHPTLGPIAFVYGKAGDRGFGLAHIAEKHGDQVLAELPEVLRRGVAGPEKNGRVYIDTQDAIPRRTVIKLAWEDQEKVWVVTSHDRYPKVNAGQGRTTDVPIVNDPPTVPGSTPQAKNTPAIAENQDIGWQHPEIDPATEAMLADLAAARADLSDELDALEIQMPDGTTATFREILDDLDADTDLVAAINACAITPGGA